MQIVKGILFVFFVGITISRNQAHAQLIPYCQKTSWGFADKQGKVIVPCIYENVEFYSDDQLARVKKAGKFGYITTKGVAVIPIEYDDCHRIYEVYHGEYSVGIETNPETNLNRNYDFMEIDAPENNRYVVSKAKKYGVLSLVAGKPKVIIPCSYSSVMFDPDKKVFHCTNGETTTLFNKQGAKMTQEQVDAIPDSRYSTAGSDNYSIPTVVSAKGKYGVVRKKGTYRGEAIYDTLVPVVYDAIMIDKETDGFAFTNNFFAVKQAGKWGAMNDKRQLILPIEYDSIHFELSKEYKHWLDIKRTFYVMQNDKWGVLGKKDSSESLIPLLPFEYDEFVEIYYKYVGIVKAGSVEIYNNEQQQIITKRAYPSIRKYKHESVGAFELFEVTNKAGLTVYVGENGVEFFAD